MTLRALIVPTRPEADALRTRVDTSHGYPRCERLAGNIVHVGIGQHVTTCPCTRADAPDARCSLATRAEALPIELVDRTWAYPVRESKGPTRDALTPAERAAVVDVAEGEVRPVVASAEPVIEGAGTR